MRLPREVARAMLDHAREARPDECCGLIVGHGRTVVRIHRATNISASPATRYLIAPADHFNAIRLARRDGLSVVGAYHSHPGRAGSPSPTDVAEASDASWLHVIVTPDDAGLHAWRIAAGNFTEIPFVTCG
jgi:proteasome lid subunit RPN8/RPN11